MLLLSGRAAIERALTTDMDAKLRLLLAERLEGLTDEVLDCTDYLIVEPGDTEEDIMCHVGFSPLIEPINGARFGEAGFHPHWDYLADRGGWFELIVSVNANFAYVLLIADADGTLAPLRAMCSLYVLD